MPVGPGRPCSDRHPDPLPAGCRLCWLYLHRPDYHRQWDGAPAPAPAPKVPREPCVYLGPTTGSTIDCPTCAGKVSLKLYACAVHGSCTLGKAVGATACCADCHDYRPRPAELPAAASVVPAAPLQPPGAALQWAYAVTTVTARRHDLLPRTLASLRAGGFDRPRLCVDGDSDGESWRREFGLETTARYPQIRTFGNWVLTLAELYIRDPHADRYAVFQDDFVCVRNLRGYLEAVPYPENGYLNLYTFPRNQRLAPADTDGRQKVGWYAGSQRGWGAVALVFSREAVQLLLTARHMVERPVDRKRGWKAVDGGIVTAFVKAGWREYVHNPSLVQHTGHHSSMANRPQPQALSFPGEDFDALTLLQIPSLTTPPEPAAPHRPMRRSVQIDARHRRRS